MYLVLRMMKPYNTVLPTSRVYGNVEIRKATSLFIEEKMKLEKSIKSFNEHPLSITTQLMAIIVEASTVNEADEKAEKEFIKILDLYVGLKYNLSTNELSEVGIIKNIDTMHIYSRVNDIRTYPTFELKWNIIEGIDEVQNFLYRGVGNKLKEDYIRFLHWLRLANEEKNLHLKCLKYWIGFEGIIKINETDQMTSHLSALSGFLEGFIGREINQETRIIVISKNNYRELRKKVNDSLERMRKLRNDTVHHSLETFEVKAEYTELIQLFRFISKNIKFYMEEALYLNLSSKEEFWCFFPELYSDFIKTSFFKLPFEDKMYDEIFIKFE